MNIGIDSNLNLVYESNSLWGHALWPTPFLSPAEVAPSTSTVLKPTTIQNLGPNLLIFREDAFDPVSRIRRGRFYRAGNSQPHQWQVYPHPAMPDENRKIGSAGVLPKSLYTFFGNPFTNELRKYAGQQVLVILGAEDSFTVWTVINIEKMASGEELATLKARQGIGALPRLNPGAIPEAGRGKVLTALDKLVEDIYRAGPESVVDRAREAATAILSAYLQDREIARPGLDLDVLIKKMEGESKVVAANAANIVRLFHGRGKSAVQEKLPVRALCEQDAELAVQCVGTILCELGWADWR